MVKLFKFVIFLLCSSSAFALPEIKLVKPSPFEVQEVSASYFPENQNSISLLSPVLMPALRTFTQFGGSRSVCGASPETNTLNCFDLYNGGQYSGSYPLPGTLSATPVFADNSWLLATAKGFLMRVEANKNNRFLPSLGGKNAVLWGAYSRQFMSSFRPKPIYTSSGNDKSAVSDTDSSQADLPVGIKWIFPASTEFVGTPVVAGGYVYALSAGEYLQAFDWETGKLVWAVRLAPDTKLRLSTNALVVTESEVIVGTDLGNVMVLNPQTGAVLWSLAVPAATEAERSQMKLPAGPDRYSSIVAPPLVIGRNIIVSNAQSMTQNISLDSHTSVWSYPLGSVAQPRTYKENIIIGTSSGKIVSLNQKTGALNWSSSIVGDRSPTPVVSLFLTKSNLLLAANWRGQIFMLHPETGEILAQNLPIGEVNGEFFAAYQDADACLSFASDGFRCFRAKGF